MKTLLKNCLILKMDDSPLFLGDIEIEDAYITKITKPSEHEGHFDVVKDIKGNIIMPSFKNAHAHSGMTFLRSKTDNVSLHTWLNDIVFPREKHLTGRAVYHLSKVACLEYLSSGMTIYFDHYFFGDYAIKAALDTGMKIVFLQEAKPVFHTLYAKYKDNPSVKVYPGMHAEYTVSKKVLDYAKVLIDEYKLPFFTHISETKQEVEGSRLRRNGMTPTQFFDSLEMYKYGGGGYHCIYLDEKDIEIFKKHNLAIVTCPGSNLKLASGIAPIHKYLENGINVAIGTDGPASNDCLNMFKEMSLTDNLTKYIADKADAISCYDVLKMATVNGAKALGFDDCDILEVGKKADLIEIDLSKPNMRPFNDIVTSIVSCGSKDNIKMTMADGKILYENGKFHLKESANSIYKNGQKYSAFIEDKYQKSLKKD